MYVPFNFAGVHKLPCAKNSSGSSGLQAILRRAGGIIINFGYGKSFAFKKQVYKKLRPEFLQEQLDNNTVIKGKQQAEIK